MTATPTGGAGRKLGLSDPVVLSGKAIAQRIKATLGITGLSLPRVHIDGGVETVEGPLPIVITVNGSAAPCRPRNAKLVQKYKHAKTVTEKQQGNLDYTDLYDKRDYLNLVEWSVADVNGDLAQCGLSGSPTKVKAIQNIVFQAKESKTISGSDRDVEDLIVELLANHTIG